MIIWWGVHKSLWASPSLRTWIGARREAHLSLPPRGAAKSPNLMQISARAQPNSEQIKMDEFIEDLMRLIFNMPIYKVNLN